MTFDETIASLRAGKCVSRPNEGSYLRLEGGSLVKRYKDGEPIVSSGETIPCGGPELSGADIGYEVYRPRAVVSEEDAALIKDACGKANATSVTLERDENGGRSWLRLSEGEAGGEWKVLAPKGARFSGMIEGRAYRPDEIVARGEKK